MISFTDSELDTAMDEYARGDDAAFRIVYASLSDRFSAFLRRLTGSNDIAQDLVQETFLRIHRARGSFGHGARAVPWAYAIARNVAIDYLRLRSKRAEAETEAVNDATHEPVAGPETNAEAMTSALETTRIVERELERMTLARREAFVLLRCEGFTAAAAAKVLAVSEGAVRLRAFHASAAIREALKNVERVAA